jgi:small subunit ribosomal protein S20
MPNTSSAKKALRSSTRKRQHNLYWKRKIKDAVRDVKKTLSTKGSDVGILNTQLSALQKVLDKAAKEKVIHKNKARRLKSRYAKRITAQTQSKKTKVKKQTKEAAGAGKTAKRKRKKAGKKK